MARPFPKELKEEVLAIALKREVPVTQLAKDFGVSAASIHNWVTKAEGGLGAKKPSDIDPVEIRAAQKRIRTLEQENEILRRAAAYFSRDVLPK
jgi:transposase-like protein